MESSALVFLVPAAALIGAAIIVKAIIDSWTKMRCKEIGPLEPGSADKSGGPDSRIEINRLLVNLKWSLVLIGLGFPPALSYFCESLPTEVIFGLMMLFAGCGLFIYFLLAKSMLDRTTRKKRNDE